jgi:hypothetical protein
MEEKKQFSLVCPVKGKPYKGTAAAYRTMPRVVGVME